MLKQDDLSQFTGTENWYAYGLDASYSYTDGVRHVAKEGGAYWLLDKIVASQSLPCLKGERWQSWVLMREPVGFKAWIQVTDGDDRVLHKEDIAFTDFPLTSIAIWMIDRVMLLPSEY